MLCNKGTPLAGPIKVNRMSRASAPAALDRATRSRPGVFPQPVLLLLCSSSDSDLEAGLSSEVCLEHFLNCCRPKMRLSRNRNLYKTWRRTAACMGRNFRSADHPPGLRCQGSSAPALDLCAGFPLSRPDDSIGQQLHPDQCDGGNDCLAQEGLSHSRTIRRAHSNECANQSPEQGNQDQEGKEPPFHCQGEWHHQDVNVVSSSTLIHQTSLREGTRLEFRSPVRLWHAGCIMQGDPLSRATPPQFVSK